MSQSPQDQHAPVQDAWQPQPGRTSTGGGVPVDRPTAPGLVTGTMGRRLGARLLDGLVLVVPFGVVVGVLAGVTAASAQETGEPSPAAIVTLFAVAYFVLPVTLALYEILLTARGGTLGKRWLGLRVVRRDSGSLPGGMAAFLRWLVYAAVSLVPFVGTVLVAISPFFDSSGLRQGWHDLAAGTRVVDVRPERGGRSPAA